MTRATKKIDTIVHDGIIIIFDSIGDGIAGIQKAKLPLEIWSKETTLSSRVREGSIREARRAIAPLTRVGGVSPP